MKNVLEKKDYDLYKIQLPFSMITAGRRKRFLITELGKQHPRFSDEYCFDSKLRLGKKGFSCDVVVMDKFRLAEIKKEGEHNRVYIPEEKKSFFDTKIQKIVTSPLFYTVLCLFFIGIASGKFIYYKKKSIQTHTDNFDSSNKLEKKGNLETSYKNESVYSVEQFFDDITDSKGEISWFEWSKTDRTQCFSAQITNSYPENISSSGKNVNFSAVSYSHEIPIFTVTVKNQIIQNNQNIESEKIELTANSLFPSIRSMLKKNNSIILQENQNPFSIVFYCPPENKLFTELSAILQNQKIEISNIRIQMANSEKEMLEVRIIFTSAEFSDQKILSLLGDNLNLFKEKRNITMEKSLDGKTSNRKESVTKKELFPGVKTGEITYADGSRIVFYKTSEGKTVKRKEFR